MPAGNKTGPLGRGPMTGRGLGSCNQDSSRTFFGFGRWRGLARGYGYSVDETSYDEVQSLKNRISDLEEIIKNK